MYAKVACVSVNRQNLSTVSMLGTFPSPGSTNNLPAVANGTMSAAKIRTEHCQLHITKEGNMDVPPTYYMPTKSCALALALLYLAKSQLYPTNATGIYLYLKPVLCWPLLRPTGCHRLPVHVTLQGLCHKQLQGTLQCE